MDKPPEETIFSQEIKSSIYRRLNSGANVYMAAPRRVGKTAIMRYLEDNPRENYEFKYIITESVDSPIIYFKQLSDSLHNLKSLSKKSIDAIKHFMPEFERVSVITTGVEFKFAERHKVFEDFKKLINGLDTQGKTVIIMVDEFPQTVENILRQQGQGAAEQFLQFNREIRHQASENVRFILTGSIGLPTIAEKLSATKEINDLNVIEIPPLSRDEANALTIKLLDYEKISYSDGAIESLLDKLEWFIPFYIQLAVQEIIDVYFETEEMMTEMAVDNALANITKRRNDIYFDHYYSRLKKSFSDTEHPFALAVLKTLTQQDELTLPQINALADSHLLDSYPIVLRTLEFDGYIFSVQKDNETVYQFTSPILRRWWRQYVL